MDTIRPLEAGDWEQWLPLWRGYLDFYRTVLPEATTQYTFERLTAADGDMFGLIAMAENGAGVGLAHCLTHPSTFSERSYCYLEDLFVAPAARGTEVGRALLEEAKRASTARGAEKLYWHTQEYNGRARSLYDQVGRLTSFVVYEL